MTHLAYVSIGNSSTSTSLSLASAHDTSEQNSMCPLVSVKGKGKPPKSGANMYLLILFEQGCQ